MIHVDRPKKHWDMLAPKMVGDGEMVKDAGRWGWRSRWDWLILAVLLSAKMNNISTSRFLEDDEDASITHPHLISLL